MRTHHYGLTVSDLEEALGFYRDTLGFEEVYRTEVDSEAFARIVGVEDAAAEVAFLDANGMVIELFEYHPSGDRVHDGKQANDDVGASHVAFHVDDAAAWHEEHADEIEFVNPPKPGGTGTVAAYMYDPDGNVVEILEADTMGFLPEELR